MAERTTQIELVGGSVVEQFALPPAQALSVAEIRALWEACPAEQDEIVVCGRRVRMPRFNCAYGQPYRFCGRLARIAPTPPRLDTLRRYIGERLGFRPNGLLVNWYPTGAHYIGEHSDDEREIEPGTPIVTVSLGATRDFVLKSRKGLPKQRLVLPLASNSVLVMRDPCQRTHKHGVPKRKRVEPWNGHPWRISVTLRQFRQPTGAPTAPRRRKKRRKTLDSGSA